MPTITFLHANDTQDRLSVPDGTSLMRAAVSNGVNGIIGECGGQAMCATCHVYVRQEYLAALPQIGEDEDEMLDCTASERTERSRLGCQIEVGPDIEEIAVEIPEGQV